MIEIIVILCVLAVYGWYMHKQGSKYAMARGIFLGGAAVLCKQIYDKTMTRAEAKKIMPMLADDIIEEYLTMFENVSKNAAL